MTIYSATDHGFSIDGQLPGRDHEKPIIDRDSHAYFAGFNQALHGREFRNPCAGNSKATDNHYFGYLAGETAKAKGYADIAEYFDKEGRAS